MTSSSEIDEEQRISEDDEFINEYMRPCKVVVSDGNGFKTVIGD